MPTITGNKVIISNRQNEQGAGCYGVAQVPGDMDRQIQEAAAILNSGGVCAIPTETGYGLAASIDSPNALERIYRIKRRPLEKPLLILANSVEQAPVKLSLLTGCARKIMDRFWPGPVTLLLPAIEGLHFALTGGTGRIGVRVPSHPVAMKLVRAVGRPVTATSANLSGERLTKTIPEVMEQLGSDPPDYFLDAGSIQEGPASTIVDASVLPPAIVRAGAVSPEDILDVCETVPS